MTRSINTYQDLLEEKERLTQLLKAQKELVRLDFEEIKEELAPIRTAFTTIGKFTTRDSSNPLLSGVTNTFIDIVIRKLLLNKSSWLTRLVVPFVMKNFSSHVIADNKESIFAKIFSLFNRKKENKRPNVQETEED